LEYEGGGMGDHITPTVFGVYDRSTGEKLGEVTAWDENQAAEKIAKGEWD
jgi:hypothetical protein